MIRSEGAGMRERGRRRGERGDWRWGGEEQEEERSSEEERGGVGSTVREGETALVLWRGGVYFTVGILEGEGILEGGEEVKLMVGDDRRTERRRKQKVSSLFFA